MAVLPTPGSPMSTGLFLVRRERIWTTRSSSFERPMTGSSWLLRAACGEVDAELVDGGGAGGLAGAGACGGGLGRGLAEDAGRLGADALEVDAEAFEDAGGDAFAFADEAEEQVLGADVAVVQAARLVDRELDDLLGARGEADFAEHGAVATADDELDGGTDLVQFDAQVGEHLGRDAIAFADEAEEDVLGADVVVVEAVGFFLRERQDTPRPFGELVESIGHVLLQPPGNAQRTTR